MKPGTTSANDPLIGGGPGKLILALDKKTGRELWASQTCDGDFGYNPPIIYEFGGRRQLIVWHSQAVVSLDPETGKRIWRVPFASRAALTVPMARKVGDDKLFFVSFYHGSFMLKVGADNAEFVWKSSAKGERPKQTTDLSGIMSTPFVESEHIYGVGSYGEFRCLDLDGKRIWSTMKATRGSLTPAKIAASDEPGDGERWSNAFIVKNGERFFLFNEQGDLIIAKLSPEGLRRSEPGAPDRPAEQVGGPQGGLDAPGVRGPESVRAERRGDDLLRTCKMNY